MFRRLKNSHPINFKYYTCLIQLFQALDIKLTGFIKLGIGNCIL